MKKANSQTSRNEFKIPCFMYEYFTIKIKVYVVNKARA